MVYSSVDGLAGGSKEVVKLSDGTGAVEVCLLSGARGRQCVSGARTLR